MIWWTDACRFAALQQKEDRQVLLVCFKSQSHHELELWLSLIVCHSLSLDHSQNPWITVSTSVFTPSETAWGRCCGIYLSPGKLLSCLTLIWHVRLYWAFDEPPVCMQTYTQANMPGTRFPWKRQKTWEIFSYNQVLSVKVQMFLVTLCSLSLGVFLIFFFFFIPRVELTLCETLHVFTWFPHVFVPLLWDALLCGLI